MNVLLSEYEFLVFVCLLSLPWQKLIQKLSVQTYLLTSICDKYKKQGALLTSICDYTCYICG